MREILVPITTFLVPGTFIWVWILDTQSWMPVSVLANQGEIILTACVMDNQKQRPFKNWLPALKQGYIAICPN